jgi:hypothetical protein
MNGERSDESSRSINTVDSIDTSALTVDSSGPSVECESSVGVPVMADDPRLEKAFALIREVIADERKKTIADMLKGAHSSSAEFSFSESMETSGKPQRAPSGSARLLCERTLGAAAQNGLTTTKIHELAETQYEKMVSISAIRNELGTGEKAKPPRYRQVGGVWYLTPYAPSLMKVINN